MNRSAFVLAGPLTAAVLHAEPLGRPTTAHERQYQIASELFTAQRALLKTLVETDVAALARELERAGAPFTP